MKIPAYKMFGIFYLLAAVVCYGPATVESERFYAQRYADCRIQAPNPDECMHTDLSSLDGAIKALLWPLWVSYYAAKNW